MAMGMMVIMMTMTHYSRGDNGDYCFVMLLSWTAWVLLWLLLVVGVAKKMKSRMA